MDWSFIAGPVASLAGGFFSQSSAKEAAAQQFQNQKQLMAMQHAYNVSDFENRYQRSVWDMRRAGLNPILAATQGIGGNINGVSAGSAAMASTPDFSHLGDVFNSARSISSQKDIAKMQNEVAKDDLRLKEIDINSAKEKRENDIIIERGRFQLEKYVQEAAVKRADALNDATIQNMKDRLEAEKEHWYRSDMNGAALAAAAMQSANAAGLQAEVARQLGISKSAVMEAEQAYIGLQSENAQENLKWQRWLNDHPETRGAVGFLGALFDTVATAKGVKNLGNSVADMVD